MKERIGAGFKYLVEVVDRSGRVVDSSIEKNLMPEEGQNYVLESLFKGGTVAATWYIGLYSGAYTPNPSDEMATFAAQAIEVTDYAETLRQAFVPGSVVSGNVSNALSKAEFEFLADTTVTGGFISSAAGKGGTSGVLISAVRFSSPKQLSAGSILRVTAGFSLASL